MRAMIVGMGRSGTSFLGELFRQNREMTYLFEPFWGENPIRRDQLIWRTEEDTWPEGARLVADVFEGRFDELCRAQREPMVTTGAFETRKEELVHQFGSAPSAAQPAVVVKCIRLNLQLRWLALECMPEMKLVHVVRDPRGVVASLLFDASCRSHLVHRAVRGVLVRARRSKPKTMFRQWGWGENRGARRLAPGAEKYVPWLDHGRPHERIAARWALLAGQAIEDSAHLPESSYVRVRYEDLCRHPVETADRVYSALGLPLPSEVSGWLGANTVGGDRKDRFSTSRDSAAMVDVWKKQLPRSDVREVERICGPMMEAAGYPVSGGH